MPAPGSRPARPALAAVSRTRGNFRDAAPSPVDLHVELIRARLAATGARLAAPPRGAGRASRRAHRAARRAVEHVAEALRVLDSDPHGGTTVDQAQGALQAASLELGIACRALAELRVAIRDQWDAPR